MRPSVPFKKLTPVAFLGILVREQFDHIANQALALPFYRLVAVFLSTLTPETIQEPHLAHIATASNVMGEAGAPP